MFYQQLLQREKQFSAEHPDGEKNRATLLKVLMELAPKPKHGKKLSSLDIIRASMQRLAGDWIWQYICAIGRSGTKISMQSTMPQIMDIVVLTACKILSVDPKDGTSALSTYLKNTSTRASAKRHREKPEVGRNIENEFHSRGADSDMSSDSEESQSLLAQFEQISDYSDTE